MSENKCCKNCYVDGHEFEPGEITPTAPHCANESCPCHTTESWETWVVDFLHRYKAEGFTWNHANAEMLDFIRTHFIPTATVKRELENLTSSGGAAISGLAEHDGKLYAELKLLDGSKSAYLITENALRDLSERLGITS